jgi:hypothetical protein
MNFFMWKQLEEHIYVCLQRTIEYLALSTQAAVTAVDENVIRCIRENVMRCTALCFEREKGRFVSLLLPRDFCYLIFDALGSLICDVYLANKRHA